MKKFLSIILILIGLITLIYFVHPPQAEDITWGVNFSQKQASDFNLDWQEVYLAILNDLGAKNIKVAAHWDLIEPERDILSFSHLDWTMDQSAQSGAKVFLAVGMKTPRWPECHIPQWANDLSQEELQAQILEMLEASITRYKDHPALEAWQVENEPLVRFGPHCPFYDASFLQQEIELAKSIDPNHQVFTSDSGELSFWFQSARHADQLAVTQYRRIWSRDFNTYMSLPVPQSLYSLRAWAVQNILGKDVIVGELQAEPWVKGELTEVPLEETLRTMSFEHLRSNIEFAKDTGLDTFYLWGAEWWYHMKENHNQAEFWNEAKSLFATNGNSIQ